MKSLALLVLPLLVPAVPSGTPQGRVPAACVTHTAFDGAADVAGDYRCAGMPIHYHTTGAVHSPSLIWAGQWLFVDQAGHFRKGWCTFNRGTHPTTAVPSRPVAQRLPLDPGGRKAAYLSWRFRDTTDALTAAALWAVFHHYAADAAGSNRSDNPAAPLVADLGTLAAASGRADLQSRAVQLDAEARSFSEPWQLRVALDATGLVRVSLSSGDTPVPEASVQVLVSGDDASHPLLTGADGKATVTVPLPPGTVTVAATAEAPGEVQVYRGVPASPNPNGAQTLLVAGPPTVLHATATLTPIATTTTAATTSTTTLPPTTTTTAPPTTTTTTTTATTTTTTTVPPTTTTTVPPTTLLPTTVPPSARPPLPRTGTGGDGRVAQVATAFLVGGVGLLGTLRRRTPRHPGAA